MGRQQQQPARLQQEYEVAGVIGEGGFGLVRAATHKRTKTPVAVKTMTKDQTSHEKFWQEVAILKQLGGQHNVLELRDAFETSDSYVLVTELVEGGELFDHLMTTGVFAESKAKQLVQQVCHALSYMHSRNVVHADIKPENILIADDAADQMQIRLIDFGVAYREHDILERLRSVHDGLGTVAYAAPEFITMQESGCAVDMWALGVVLYVILAGRHPFDVTNDATDAQLKERILAGQFDMDALNECGVSDEARDLIHRLLVVDPAERLTAVEALNHAWLADC
ncbi:TPA: hypothetical protein N0F65_006500 [Lagenidium giganteum]|uniref:Protein kinase domain-containing protein n=1 Tax=Lagenidium giganteum TaxID=4803 RepID=A0AAV2YT99_9STRA|nr:TPA: hypothetical protein N0F65_006500 [Lagenidium giganteum]